MSLTFAVDKNNDLFLGPDGNLAMASGAAAVAYAAKQAMQGQLREMVLQQDQGLPNFDTIWNGVPNIGIWKARARATLRAVPDVLDVTKLLVTQRDNRLLYKAIIQTVYGEIIIGD